jgi:cysteine desulfurase/selenocysteine lyase
MSNYLNSAGAGLMSDKTYNAITNYLTLERKIGAYHAAAENKLLSEGFYINAAKIINAKSSNEIAFVDSASRGWNMVVYGVLLKEGDKIVTLSSEFGTNLITLFDRAKQINGSVSVIECDTKGEFSIDAFEQELKNGAKLVAISHAVAQGSIVNPVEEIGVLVKKYGATYIVDGCQAVGQFPVDVQKIQCDAYMTTGRKWLCGPRGTGFLYVKHSSPFRTTQLDLASADLIFDKSSKVIGIEIRKDARQFELWEKSIANMIGLSSAINECLDENIEIISDNIQKLSNQLRSIASENSKINLIGKTISISGILGFYLKDFTQEEYLHNEFKNNGISISTMSDWDCPLHFPKNGSTKIFRLSPHHNTDEFTIEKACNIISNF